MVAGGQHHRGHVKPGGCPIRDHGIGRYDEPRAGDAQVEAVGKLGDMEHAAKRAHEQPVSQIASESRRGHTGGERFVADEGSIEREQRFGSEECGSSHPTSLAEIVARGRRRDGGLWITLVPA